MIYEYYSSNIYSVVWSFGLSSQAQSSVETRVNLGGYPNNMPKKALILRKGALGHPKLTLKNSQGLTLKEDNISSHVFTI